MDTSEFRLTKREFEKVKSMYDAYSDARKMEQFFVFTFKRYQPHHAVSKLLFCMKTKGENEGQYGYYSSHPEIMELIFYYMIENKVKSFMDLGCGLGTILYTLAKEGCRKIAGVEIEPALIELGQALYANYSHLIKIKHENIFNLTKSDIRGYEMLFLYEPMIENKQRIALLEHLHKISTAKHHIAYHMSPRLSEPIFNVFQKNKSIDIKYMNPYVVIYQKQK